MVRSSKLGSVPNSLVPLPSRQLAWDLDRFPAKALSDRQLLSLSLTERGPYGLPAAELSDAARPLRKRKEQAIAHAALARASRPTKAPSAVEHTMTGRSSAAASAVSLPFSTSASMLPPKPAPMILAPKQPDTAHAFS